jgi:hypothetical protein
MGPLCLFRASGIQILGLFRISCFGFRILMTRASCAHPTDQDWADKKAAWPEVLAEKLMAEKCSVGPLAFRPFFCHQFFCPSSLVEQK